jgi:hypothetical protein
VVPHFSQLTVGQIIHQAAFLTLMQEEALMPVTILGSDVFIKSIHDDLKHC